MIEHVIQKDESDKDQAAPKSVVQMVLVTVVMLIVEPTLFSDDILIFERYQHV